MKTTTRLWAILLIILSVNNSYASENTISANVVSNRSMSNTDDAQLFLKNTNNTIHSAKKWQKAGNHPESDVLQTAIKLSELAQSLYNNGQFDEAVKCSSKSRALALQMLSQYSTPEYIKPYEKRDNESSEYLLGILSNDQTSLEYWTNQLN